MVAGISGGGWRTTRKAAGVLALLVTLAAAFALWRDPWWVIRAEFARQRMLAGLALGDVQVAGHRWVYAYNDDAPANAPVLVMVHGFTGSKENWYPLARQLRGRFHLLIPDLPGWGASERKTGQDYGFGAQAQRVAAFIRATSGNRPVVLLGHSMGGGISALVAARYPDEVARLGLFDAAGVRFDDNRFGVEVLAGRNPFAVEDTASLQRYIDTVFHRPQAKPWIPWPVSTVVIRRRQQDAGFEQQVLDRIGRSDERFAPGDQAGGIQQPTLLLWCRQDAVIDPSALAIYAARIPQARKVLLEDCGHMSIMERPDAVAAAVMQLIQMGGSR